MRSGDAMIKPIRSIIKDIPTGSMLIKEKKSEGPKVCPHPFSFFSFERFYFSITY